MSINVFLNVYIYHEHISLQTSTHSSHFSSEVENVSSVVVREDVGA